jgi:hypothetical protein
VSIAYRGSSIYEPQTATSTVICVMPHNVDDFGHHTHSHSPPVALSCTCKKSRCLQLYCFCFAASSTCGTSCSCLDCHNTLANASEIMEAKTKVHKQSQSLRSICRSYAQRASAVAPSLSSSETYINPNPRSGKITMACKCKKSGCLKKYCICYSGSSFCSPACSCKSCQNTPSLSKTKPAESTNDDSIQQSACVTGGTRMLSAVREQDTILEAALAMTELMGRPSLQTRKTTDELQQQQEEHQRKQAAALKRNSGTSDRVDDFLPLHKRLRFQEQGNVLEQSYFGKKLRKESSYQAAPPRPRVESRNPSPVTFNRPNVSTVLSRESMLNDESRAHVPYHRTHSQNSYHGNYHPPPSTRGFARSPDGYGNHHYHGPSPYGNERLLWRHQHPSERQYLPDYHAMTPNPSQSPNHVKGAAFSLYNQRHGGTSTHAFNQICHDPTFRTNLARRTEKLYKEDLCTEAPSTIIERVNDDYPRLTRSGTDTTLTTTSTVSSSSAYISPSEAPVTKPMSGIVYSGSLCPTSSDDLTVDAGDPTLDCCRESLPHQV